MRWQKPKMHVMRGLRTSRLSARGLLWCGLSMWVLSACADGEVSSGPVAPGASAPAPPARTAFSLSVAGGYGGGTYTAGDTVYAFAAFNAGSSALTGWSGDAVSAGLTEWSGRFVMPARDVSLSAASAPVVASLTVGSSVGATSVPKSIRYAIPPNPRGIVMAFHGTGGSSRLIERGEGLALALELVAAGYGVVSFDSEETVAGDLDGNDKRRWDVSPTVGNVDFANLDLLLGTLRTRGVISGALPLYAFGMSNGSSMVVVLGALASQPELAARFPNLRFRAVAGYCAPGSLNAALTTRTPTAWYVCRNDTNEEVGADGNLRSAQQSAVLAARGIATDLAYNEPAPLYDERFTRAGTLDLPSSRAVVQELRNKGYLDVRSFLNRAPDRIVADVLQQGAAGFPAFARLSGAQQGDAVDALRETYADHQLFADLAKRMIVFFGRH